MKVVINTCFGGFGLSKEAVLRYLELAGKKVWPEPHPTLKSLGDIYWLVPPGPDRVKESDKEWHTWTQEQRIEHNRKWGEQVFYDGDVKRDDPLLVRVVEELGSKADGWAASLRVVEIPDGVQWEIDEYDGREHVAEAHRTWA